MLKDPAKAVRPIPAAAHLGANFGVPNFEQNISFGQMGNGKQYLRGGWSFNESVHVWSQGQHSSVRIPIAVADQAYVILIDFVPFCRPPQLPCQRLIVSLDGRQVMQLRADRAMTIAMVVPPNSSTSIAGEPPGVTVEFYHPDATQPSWFGLSDTRWLAIALRSIKLLKLRPRKSGSSATRSLDHFALAEDASEAECDEACRRTVGMGASDLTGQFESIGQNCEFGLLQRRLGAEPADLLRFAGVSLDSLLKGLSTGFEGIGGAAQVEPYLSGGPHSEYMIKDHIFELEYHSWCSADEIDEATVIQKQAAEMQDKQRRFVENLKSASKIYVFTRREPFLEEEAMAVLAMLDRYGSNRLLAVVPGSDEPSGTVKTVGPGLMWGTISQLAPLDRAGDVLLGAWTNLCLNAYQLDRFN